MRERKCDLTGKRKNSKAMSVSKSNQHTHRVQGVNLQTYKFWWETGNRFVQLRIATKTLRTIRKKGLEAVAKDYDIDLRKFAISSGNGPPPAAATAVTASNSPHLAMI
jgi:large subunit ribosomal protein L28